MNEYIRKKVVINIDTALHEASIVVKLNHRGLEGTVREILTERIIKPLLPASFSVGTGKIVDAWNNFSKQIDLIIYSPYVLPPILFSEREGIFPIEACLYSIEVKTSLNKGELRKTIQSALKLRGMSYLSGNYDKNDNPINHTLRYIVPIFFAFGSNLKTNNPEKEFNRYKELDKEWETNPIIRAFCIVGTGYWYFHEEDNKPWRFIPADANHQEVYALISGISNTVQDIKDSRKNPRIGQYIL